LKKLVALFILVAAFLSLNNNTLFSQPQFTIHLKGGYNLPLPDLKGDINDSADRINTFAINQGFGVGADAKYYLGKKRNVGITLDLMYNMFSTSEDTVNGFASNYKNKLNSFTAGLGIEYAFMPKGKANPFIGAEFTGNFYSGNVEYTVAGTTQTADLNSASRFGLGIGAGVDINLSKSIGIVIGTKYHLANLIGKEFDTTFTTGKYSLNDKEYTVGTTTIKAKSISYLQLYAGVSFYLNRPKTKTSK
jgi:outer membrane protein W